MIQLNLNRLAKATQVGILTVAAGIVHVGGDPVSIISTVIWLDCNNSIYRGEETMSTVFWAALVACGILVAVLLIARHRQG